MLQNMILTIPGSMLKNISAMSTGDDILLQDLFRSFPGLKLEDISTICGISRQVGQRIQVIR